MVACGGIRWYALAFGGMRLLVTPLITALIEIQSVTFTLNAKPIPKMQIKGKLNN